MAGLVADVGPVAIDRTAALPEGLIEDLPRRQPGVVQRREHCVGGEIRRRFVLGGEAPALDGGRPDDPFGTDVRDQVGELLVRHRALGEVGAGPRKPMACRVICVSLRHLAVANHCLGIFQDLFGDVSPFIHTTKR